MTDAERGAIASLAIVGILTIVWLDWKLRTLQIKAIEDDLEKQKIQAQLVVEHESDSDLKSELDKDLGVVREPKT